MQVTESSSKWFIFNLILINLALVRFVMNSMKITPIHKIFIAVLEFLVLLMFLFPPSPKNVNFTEVDFSVADSDQMFFNNLRAYYYEQEKDTLGGFMLMRLKKSLQEPNAFRFVIARNLEQKEAYIYLESQKEMIRDTLMLEVISATVIDSTIALTSFDMMAQFQFAGLCYQLFSDEQLSLDYNGEAFQSANMRKYNETVLKDYFKLVGKIR